MGDSWSLRLGGWRLTDLSGESAQGKGDRYYGMTRCCDSLCCIWLVDDASNAACVEKVYMS